MPRLAKFIQQRKFIREYSHELQQAIKQYRNKLPQLQSIRIHFGLH